MKFNYIELAHHVNLYCAGKLSKQELGRWASEAYYDLLRGGYLEVEKIALYPFLNTLSRIHIPCSERDDVYPSEEKDVLEIAQILSGKKPFRFCVKASIPIQAETLFADTNALNWEHRKFLQTIYDRLKTTEDIRSSLAGLSIQSNRFHCTQPPNTILEILEANIFGLLQSFYDIHSIGSSLNTELRLYASKSSTDLSEIKLLEYLECYLSCRAFLILVSFYGGTPAISLLV